MEETILNIITAIGFPSAVALGIGWAFWSHNNRVMSNGEKREQVHHEQITEFSLCLKEFSAVMTEFKSEFSIIKEDVSELKDDVSELRDDIKHLKYQLGK